MRAYSDMYLSDAQENLGTMLDYLCRLKGFQPEDAFNAFARSALGKQFERGNPAALSGRSGIEMAWQVAGLEGRPGSRTPSLETTYSRSPYFWAGWALAYYQWSCAVTFAQLESLVGINRVIGMYGVYHEMDIQHFCDALDGIIVEACPQTRLAVKRVELGYSQSQLAKVSGVSVRTIQHYEQRQKDINKAQIQQVVRLAQALFCDPMDLVEPLDKARYEYAFVRL